jgi:hypothetical protein
MGPRLPAAANPTRPLRRRDRYAAANPTRPLHRRARYADSNPTRPLRAFSPWMEMRRSKAQKPEDSAAAFVGRE